MIWQSTMFQMKTNNWQIKFQNVFIKNFFFILHLANGKYKMTIYLQAIEKNLLTINYWRMNQTMFIYPLLKLCFTQKCVSVNTFNVLTHLEQISLQTHCIYISPLANKHKPHTKDCSGNVSSCLVSCQPSDITDSNILCRETDKQQQQHTIEVFTAAAGRRLMLRL